MGNPTTIAPAALASTANATKQRELTASAIIPNAKAPAAAAPPSMAAVTRR